MKPEYFPGTGFVFDGAVTDAFKLLQPLFDAAQGLTLSQVCSITGNSPATVQNWVKRGFVSSPKNKRYNQAQLARIIIIGMLREGMRLDKITAVISYVNGRLDDVSDDIIPDNELYGIFCEIYFGERSGRFDPTSVRSRIEKHLSSHVFSSDNARERVARVLEIMLVTYTAAALKKQSDEMVNDLLKGEVL